MSDGIALLCGTAALIGLLHTLLGPDHYLPFVAMSRAGGWSLRKTVLVTLMCGIGHVLSSVVLGMVGIALGIGLFKLEAIEVFRGDLAGWLMLAFGLVYFLWGVRRAIRNKPHTHWHIHADGQVHEHEHVHHGHHMHVHRGSARAEARGSGSPPGKRSNEQSVTPWIIFTIFLFGPCEPLIPILMYPAASGRLWEVALVAIIFGGVTLATMTAVVVVGRAATGSIRFGRFERYSHALAGLALLVCGATVKAAL